MIKAIKLTIQYILLKILNVMMGKRERKAPQTIKKDGKTYVNVTEAYRSGNRKTRRLIETLDRKGKIKYL